jgi:hypothetical protein
MKKENVSYEDIIQKLDFVFNSMKSSNEIFIIIKNLPVVRNKKCINYENNFNFKTKVVADRTLSIKINKVPLLFPKKEYYIEFPVIEYKYRVKSADEDSMFDYINASLEKSIDEICSFRNIQQLVLKYDKTLVGNGKNIIEQQLISHDIQIYDDDNNKDDDLLSSLLDKPPRFCIKDIDYLVVCDMFDIIQSNLNDIIDEHFKIDNYSVIIFRDNIGHNKINQITKMNIKLFKDVNLNDCVL